MKKKLSFRELIAVGSMLFGLFFGAGNLIFPAAMGQLAGKNVFAAAAGLCITGVGLPLLGVAALGISRCSGLADLSGRVGKKYSLFFTCALYLTIGPLFAIPRCATVPFATGISPLLKSSASETVPLAVFSLIFFAAVLWFSLRPGNILTWVGKILNPLFLISLALLLITALLFPMGNIAAVSPEGAYAQKAFISGFLEGYNTMDALAGLAFGIIVVNVIRDLKITAPEAIAANTVRAGCLGCGLMGIIYLAVAVVGAQSRGIYAAAPNGGEALLTIANHYFGAFGSIILAVTVTFACLKTAVGLITSCAQTFCQLFPRAFSYRVWAIGFCLFSFGAANLGLETIISWALPVLMFLYPLAITLILLALTGKWFNNSRYIYRSVTVFTLIAAVLDFIHALPETAVSFLHLNSLLITAEKYLPLFSLGLGWVFPAAVGFIIGLFLHHTRSGKNIPLKK
ncbi:MAG: branched-chain amino acid transport system II carrier protein [Ruminococcus sp.]|jgi:LIVCS family branched-chain amino acid:cation transporter